VTIRLRSPRRWPAEQCDQKVLVKIPNCSQKNQFWARVYILLL
jgi:hypothetical protein